MIDPSIEPVSREVGEARADDRFGSGLGSNILFLVLAAGLARGALLFLRGDYLDWDEALYLIMARNLTEGAGLSLNGYTHVALGPFVPLATAAISLVSGLESLTALRILMTFSGALFIVPVWYLLRLHAGARVAASGAILLVGWTALIDVAPKLGPMWRHMYAGTEPAFLTLLFAALALGEFGMRREGLRRYGPQALAGVSLALAYLARPEAIVLGSLYALFRGWSLYRGGRARDLAPALTAASLGFLLVAAPYLVQLRQQSGSWTLSGKLAPTRETAALYRELVRDDRHMGAYLRSWWALDEKHTQLVNPYWGIDGSLSMEARLTSYRRVLEEEWPAAGGRRTGVLTRSTDYLTALWVLCLPLFAPFALLGLLRCRRDLRSCFPPFVLAPLAMSFLTAWQLFVLPRFFLYLVPALAMWAALGLSAVADFSRSRKLVVTERVFAILLVGAGLGLAALRGLNAEASERRQLGLDDRLAAERLASVIPRGTPVITWHPRLAYWGEWDWRALPVASLDAVVHYAANNEVPHLFLSKGGHSPLALEAPYVLITVDRQTVEAYRSASTAGASHPHPTAVLLPTPAVAGFPAGRITLNLEATSEEG